MFEYVLPPELIAERPMPKGRSRLLVGNHDSISESFVRDLPKLLKKETLLLLNDTKVVACRFFPPEIPNTEVFLVSQVEPGRYRVLFKPKKKFKIGSRFLLSESLAAEVISGDLVSIENLTNYESLECVIEKEGRVPIPPYIRSGIADDSDKRDYQTIFATIPGSIAAPTASLHFSKENILELKESGVEIKFLTLHVGLHSMLPIERQTSQGFVEKELFRVPEDTYRSIMTAKASGRTIMGVGTTVTRAVESLSDSDLSGGYQYQFRPTDLFIQPGFKFRIIDCLMTNFHLSGSTHLSLVSAFYGEERLRELYSFAIQKRYRFYSYGDATLLWRADR